MRWIGFPGTIPSFSYACAQELSGLQKAGEV